jgi:hypothetical protein
MARGFHATGTIMRNRIPKTCGLSEESLFKKKVRGTVEVKIRNDEKLAITRWLDNKPVLMLSTCFSDVNQDQCPRWSKLKKMYETVKRPEAIKIYNENMGVLTSLIEC